ncbi:MAG TPA: hypothetical protein V6D28_01495 [Leptolyngbyaceae cyanobacterium]
MANNQLAREQLPPPQRATHRRRSAKPAAASQKLSRSNAAKVNQVPRKPASLSKVNPVIKLIQKQPLLIWGFAWATVLLVAVIAILGLANPGTMKTVESSETDNSTLAENPLPPTEESPQLPGWLFGLAGLGCATGSWVIINQIKGSRRRRRLRKPLTSKVVTTSQAVGQPQQKNGSLPKRTVPKPKLSQRAASGKAAMAGAAKKSPVMSKKQRKNQNNGKLAESMDLRKRHPLSSFLRKL